MYNRATVTIFEYSSDIALILSDDEDFRRFPSFPRQLGVRLSRFGLGRLLFCETLVSDGWVAAVDEAGLAGRTHHFRNHLF